MTENVLPGRFTVSVSEVQAWPAMRGPLPSRVRYERGIWGKAHGAPSDFRWLARSRNFALGSRDVALGGTDLGRRLNLGPEDRPRAFTAWSVTGGSAYAVAAYPSRATDAAGRRGFLEKQVLEWRRGEDEPAVAVALVLLSEAVRLDDEEWWTRQGEIDWTDPELFVPLDEPVALELAEHHNLANDRDLAKDRDLNKDLDLAKDLAAGLAELRSRVGEDALTELYAALLGERSPARLPQDEPLPPRALACLLLPLPRELADRLSISAWIPSRRQMAGDLARRWDVLAGPVHEVSVESREIVWEQARRMARAVLRADPGELEQETLLEENNDAEAGPPPTGTVPPPLIPRGGQCLPPLIPRGGQCLPPLIPRGGQSTNFRLPRPGTIGRRPCAANSLALPTDWSSRSSGPSGVSTPGSSRGSG